MSAFPKLACAAGVLICGVAQAAQYQWFPFASLGGYYESNLGLSPVSANKQQVTGAAGEAGLALRGATPTTTLLFKPYVRATYFPGEQDADYSNAFADLDWKHAGQRSKYSLVGEFAHETVSSGALPSTELRGDLGDPRQGDISKVTNSRRDSIGVYPSVSFAVTQKQSIEVSASYLDVSYDRKLPGEELGYNFLRGALGWSYGFSQLSTISLTAATEEFDPVDAPGFVPSVGSSTQVLVGRFTRNLDERRRVYVQAGSTRTKFDRVAGVAPSASKNGYIGGVGASWQFQTSELFADLVHSVRPSSSGAVSNQTDGRVQLVRKLSPRWNATVGARIIRSKAVDPNVATDDRRFAIGSFQLEWRMRRKWSLVGTFDHIYQKLENQPGSADSDKVVIAIAYDAGRTDKE